MDDSLVTKGKKCMIQKYIVELQLTTEILNSWNYLFWSIY